MLIYLPIDATDLREHAIRWNDTMKYGTGSGPFAVMIHGAENAPLAQVKADDVLFILCHGRSSTPNQIGAIVSETKGAFGRKKRVYEFIDAVQLVQRLHDDGLTGDIKDIRLIVCWSGLAMKNQVCFAGQVSSAAKANYFKNVIVTGYTAAVQMTPSTQNFILGGGRGSHATISPEQLSNLIHKGPVKGFTNIGDENQSLFELLKANDHKSMGFGKTVWL